EAGLAGRGIRSVNASASTGTVLVLFEGSHDLVEITRRLGETAERALDTKTADAPSDRPPWHAMDPEEVIGAVRSRPSGLSDAEAKTRLVETGANAIPPVRGRTQLEILISQFQNMPTALLAAGALLSIATGGVLDAAIILGVIGLNGAIGFFAEARAEETISSLNESRSPVSRVLRDGKECDLPAEDLVPGDLIELRRDEIVPADARVIAANRFTVNEAVLTGESVPVAKAANVMTPQSAPIADRRNMVFRGTVVTGGAGRAVVTATGPDTELGRIQSLLGSEDQVATPLQRQLDTLGRQLVFGSAAACGLFAVIGLIRGFGLISLLKTVISLAVAAVPEGLPTLATTTLALAIQDLRRRGIIVRRLSAVEGLGTVDVACFDKTGTLTLNDMSVVRLYWNDTRARLVDEQFRTEAGSVVDSATDRELARLLELAALCNDVELLDATASDANGSATEVALVRAAMRVGLEVETIRARHPRRATLERAEDRRYMLTVHDGAADQQLVIVKGDPAEILALCRWRLCNGVVSALEAEDRRMIEVENLAMAEDALRVLGIAYRTVGAEDRGTRIEQAFIWTGLVGMADPIRKGAPNLISAFRRAGITSIMLTGDQRATAAAIATELGLSNGNRKE
ncbi:MAG: HAD-IC family P-type ATPase, partial [Stellaceae bacterium]